MTSLFLSDGNCSVDISTAVQWTQQIQQPEISSVNLILLLCDRSLANGTGFVHHSAPLLLFVLSGINPFHQFSWATLVSGGMRHQMWNGLERPRNLSVFPRKSIYSLKLTTDGPRPLGSRPPALPASWAEEHIATHSCQELTVRRAAHRTPDGLLLWWWDFNKCCKDRRNSKKCCF